MKEESLFNYNTLMLYVNGNNVLGERIKRMIVAEIPKDLAKMEAALHKEDWGFVGAMAHKIKPIIQMCGNKKLYDCVESIEKDGKQHLALHTMGSRLRNLKLQIALLLTEIEHHTQY